MFKTWRSKTFSRKNVGFHTQCVFCYLYWDLIMQYWSQEMKVFWRVSGQNWGGRGNVLVERNPEQLWAKIGLCGILERLEPPKPAQNHEHAYERGTCSSTYLHNYPDLSLKFGLAVGASWSLQSSLKTMDEHTKEEHFHKCFHYPESWTPSHRVLTQK